MTQETPEKVVETTTPAAPQETNKEIKEDKKPADPPAPVASTKIKEPEIDYKAELEKKEKQLGQAEHTIVTMKQKDKDKKIEEDAKLTEEEVENKINERVDAKVDEIRQDSVKDTIDLVLDSLTNNPDEKALIKHHYENTIVKTGYSKEAIKNDLENSKWQANRKTITQTVENLEDKVASDNAITNSGGGSSPVKTKPEQKVSLTAGEEATLARMNRSRETNGRPILTPQEFKQKVASQGDSVVSPSSVA